MTESLMGTVFVGSKSRILSSGDMGSTWEEWRCPLKEITTLAVDKTFLVVAGGMEMAATVLRYEGLVWQVVELPDEAAEVSVIYDRGYVSTKSGRLFTVYLRWRPSLLERLGLKKTAPAMDLAEHHIVEPADSDGDMTAITFSGG